VTSNQRTLRRNGWNPTSPILVTQEMEALSSSETSVLTRAAQHNIPEDTIRHHCMFNYHFIAMSLCWLHSLYLEEIFQSINMFAWKQCEYVFTCPLWCHKCGTYSEGPILPLSEEETLFPYVNDINEQKFCYGFHLGLKQG
jgi:hypothetical protein